MPPFTFNTVPSLIFGSGTVAQLEVWRAGREQRVDVRVDQLDEQQARNDSRVPSGESSQENRLGLSVRPLLPQEKQQIETTGTLVIEQVNGPAAAAGVQPGDIILAVNAKRVKTLAELRQASSGAGKTVALLIQRGDAQIFIPLRLG